MNSNDSVCANKDETSDSSGAQNLTRRQLMLAGGAVATAFTIVPRHVLGGAGFVAPSEKITLACIGFGTQAIREIGGILASPDVQIVAVCDVEKDGVNYLEWDKNDIRDKLLDNRQRVCAAGRDCDALGQGRAAAESDLSPNSGVS